MDQQAPPALADLRHWNQQTVVNRKRGDLVGRGLVDGDVTVTLGQRPLG